MAVIAQNCEIYAGGADLACALDSFALAYEAEEIDTTKLCTGSSRTFLPSLKKGTLSASGCFEHDETNADEIENILRAAFDSQVAVPMSASFGAVASGGLAILLDANETAFDVNATQGELVMASISATANKFIHHGVWVYKGSVSASSVDGASVDNTTLTSNGGLFHAHAYDGGSLGATDTAFTLQHSTDDATWADLVAYTATGAGIGAVSAEVPLGTTVNRYLRVQFQSTDGLGYAVAAFARY